MKKIDMLKELRGMEASGLAEKALTLKEELMKLRFRQASGQLEQAHQIPHLRRNLARVRTAISAHDNKAA